ncbi:hypothetical protein HG530_009122 [Fusarium avenaceum]|nr:hypothetical protein DER45DRAFT_333518 [Fusarium avenaceum]KAI6763142.1 hypothetical protein HG530_009122 [Fusarium avenaceum]
MPSSREQTDKPRFLAVFGGIWAGRHTESRDGSSQTSIEQQARPTQLQHEPPEAGPSHSTQVESLTETFTLTPGTSSTPAVTVTPSTTLTPGVSPRPEESSTAPGFSSPADSLAVATNPGFQVLSSQNPRSEKIKYPGHVASCPVCSKPYTHTTTAWPRWLNSEQRVYIACGHAFGSPCIKKILDGLAIDGRNHRCPMGSCASIIHECSHITIPTLTPPPEPLPVEGPHLLPKDCEYCQTIESRKLQRLLYQHHGKIRTAEEKLRTMPKTNPFVRLVWRVQSKWHNWKFDRITRNTEIQYQSYRNRRFDEIARQRMLWEQAYVWPDTNMSPDELEAIRRGLALRPDDDLPDTIVRDPQTLPLRRPGGLPDITEESGPAEENIEVIKEDKGKGKENAEAIKQDKGKGKEKVEVIKEDKGKGKENIEAIKDKKGKGKATTNHPENRSMADYIASNSWNLPPESNASSKTPAPSQIPKRVRFADPPPEAIRAVKSPESSSRIGSLGGILMNNSPASGRNSIAAKRVDSTAKTALPVDSQPSPKRAAESFAKSFSESSVKSNSSRNADSGTNVGYINRRLNIGHEVLNHDEEVGDSKIPDAKEPGSSSQ